MAVPSLPALTCLLIGTLSLTGCDREQAPAAPGGGSSTAQSVQTAYEVEAMKLRQQRTEERQASAPEVSDPVRGRVIGPNGEPLRADSVTLLRQELLPPRRQVERVATVPTGVSGKFVFRERRGSGLAVEVYRKGFVRVIVPVPEALPELRVQLERGFTLDGQVLAPDDSVAANCEVWLDGSSDMRIAPRRVRTDARGRFRFRDVPAGSVRLSARSPKFQPAHANILATGRAAANYTLRFEEEALHIAGQVRSLDADEPLPQARVLVYSKAVNGQLHQPFEALSDAEGRFDIQGLGFGEWTMEVRHPKHSTVIRNLSLSGSRDELAPVELGPRAEVAGKLSAGAAAAGRRLTLISYHGEIENCRVAADGAFSFESGVSFGPATLVLEVGDLAFADTQSLQLPLVLTKRETKSLQIETAPATLLEGLVKDPGGKGLAGVVIYSSWLRAGSSISRENRALTTTGKDGRFILRGLPPETVDLRFRHPNYALGEITVTPTEGAFAPAQLQLTQPGRVAGRVSRGKGPLAGALVYVGRGLRIYAQAISGPDGRYVLDGLPAGNHVVKARFPGLPLAHHDEVVAVTPGELQSKVDIRFPAGRQITGQVKDQEDLPISGMKISSVIGTATRTDGTGRFSLEVPMGRSLLLMEVPGHPMPTQLILRAGQQTVDYKHHLVRRAQLSARVLGMPSGEPLPGVQISLLVAMDRDGQRRLMQLKSPQSLMGSTWQTFNYLLQGAAVDMAERVGEFERWVDCNNGRLQLENLPEGNFRLHVYARGYRPLVREVTLLSGRVLGLGDLTLKQGGRVSGQVLDSRGNPVRRARVVLGRESYLNARDARVTTRTDAEGKFVLAGLALDAREIYVAAEGLATTVYRCQLPQDLMGLRKRPIQIRMRQGASFKLTYVGVDLKGGKRPLRFRSVLLRRGLNPVAEVETGADGVARFHNLRPGNYFASLRGTAFGNMVLKIPRGSEGRVIERKRSLRVGRRMFRAQRTPR